MLGILYFVLGGVASQTFTLKRERFEPYINEAIVVRGGIEGLVLGERKVWTDKSKM